jgi:hypothetical protein
MAPGKRHWVQEAAMEAVRTVIMAEGDSVTVPLPAALRNRRVEVIVLPAEENGKGEPPTVDQSARRERIRAVIRELRESNAAEVFGDPLEWQKNERIDRPLPGREED